MIPSRIKYPRTPHLPWSPGATSDDAKLPDASHFEGRRVIVTEKMDGENTTMQRSRVYARSVDSRHHPSRDWVKALHGRIAWQIPFDVRLCGENLYARHSIAYDELPSYFMLFSVWDGLDRCLPWSATIRWATTLGLVTVPVLYDGVFDRAWLAEHERGLDLTRCEGYVVRLAESFAHGDFARSVAKWVRPNHVQTDEHWRHRSVVPNGLSS